MTSEQQDEYIKQGFRCYRKNIGDYINPYNHGTPPYNLFERGWTQALKIAPERLAKKYEELRKSKRA